MYTMIIVEKPLAGGAGQVHLSGFSTLLTRVNVLVFLLFPLFGYAAATNNFPTSPSPYLAQYYNGASSNGGTASVSFTYNPTSQIVTVNWSHSGTTVLNTAAGVEWGTATGAGTGKVVTGSNNAGAGGSGTATISGRTPGSWVVGQVLVDNTSGAGTYVYGNFYWQLPTGTYYADFTVPANTGSETVNVRFYQNGVLKSTYIANAGSGAHDVHLTGLDATGIITVIYGYPGWKTMAGGTIVSEADQEFDHAGGAQPTAAAEPPDPTILLPFRTSPPVKKSPVAVTPTTLPTAQSTPTNVPNQSAATVITKYVRTTIGVPFGSPSGSSGVTKQDSEVVANALAAAVETADANRQGSDDKQIDATNKVAETIVNHSNTQLSALNALRTETVAGRNKQIDVAGQNQRTLESILVEERKSNSTLDQMAVTLGSLELSAKAPAPETTNPTMATLVGDASDYMASITEATEVQPAMGSVATDDTSMGEDIPEVTLPGGGVTTHTISLNPLHNPKVQQLASLFRALVGWTVLFILIAWTYIQIPIWMTEALKGGSGFTAWRAAVGAVPMIGIAVMTVLIVAGGAVILTAPTIYWAYADPLMMGSSGTALVDIRAIITSYGGTGAGQMISLLDAVCPTGLCMTAAFNYITLRVGGQAICAGLIAFSKILAS